MELVALKPFKVRTKDEIIEIEKDMMLVVPDKKARVLIQNGLAEPAKSSLAIGLTPELQRRLSAWGCLDCSWLLSDDEPVCVVEHKKSLHMLTISRLKDCPRRNKQIRRAIIRGDHLSCLN